MTAIATTTTDLAHRIRLVHAATGAALPVRPVGLDLSWGWRMRVVGADVLLTRRDGAPELPVAAGEPAARVDLVVADGVIAAWLDFGALAADQPENSVRVSLTAVDLVVPVDPLATTIMVTLAAQGTGDPSTGRAVTLRPQSGTAVTLAESPPGSGTYQAGPRVWGAAFNPADLRIGTTTVRKVSPDYSRAVTRIHAVDPT